MDQGSVLACPPYSKHTAHIRPALRNIFGKISNHHQIMAVQSRKTTHKWRHVSL